MTATPSDATPDNVLSTFSLAGRVAIITGGAGLLGQQHAQAIASAGGIPVQVDIQGANSNIIHADITNAGDVRMVLEETLKRYGRVDILINNAARNPRIESKTDTPWSRFEQFTIDQWEADLAVGLTGAFLCAQVIGTEMARRKQGVILNIASDLAVIGPDQRIYRIDGLSEEQQPVKPITYSVVKTALIGLTRYLATYWAKDGVRVNALSPGGVFNNQEDTFVHKLTELIPMGRMARLDEYQASVLFLCSDASAYMTGHNLVIDGGRTCW